MKRFVLCIVIVLAIAGVAGAGDEWKSEFESVCSRTQDAMSIPDTDLQSLVERCDRLKPQLEALEASPRKVYLKRLKLCRDLYVYVLESRKKAKTTE